MNKTLLIALFLPVLFGCSSCPIVPDTIKEVPIKVNCNITPPDKPVMPLDKAVRGDDIFANLKKALGEIDLRIGYEIKLEQAIKDCNDNPTNN